MALEVDDGEFRQDGEIAEIQMDAVVLIGIARLQRLHQRTFLIADLDHNDNVRVLSADFFSDRHIVGVFERGVERHDANGAIIGWRLKGGAVALGLDMRPQADADEPGNNQNDSGQCARRRHDEADETGRGDERELRCELGEDIENDPQSTEAASNESAETE